LKPGKEYKFGRGSQKDFGIDYPIDVAGVSREHCKIKYDKDQGWLIREFSDTKLSTSGTWLHPKTYNRARMSKNNSEPVRL
jgi:pSer/pThr/pTyr-binding forkhead associated (FHA) protein